MPVAVNDLISFDVNAAMASQYTAGVRVTNQISQYDQTLIATVLNVTLNCAATIQDVSFDSACFGGNKLWVNGLIAGVEEAEAISEKVVSLRVKSFFARLAKKPVSTEDLSGVDATTAIDDTLTDYLGIPGALIDVTTDGDPICASISGNNSLEELKRVAQAGGASLFVTALGILTVDTWKDNTSGADWTIPDEAIVSATIQRNDEIPATRIKVRGCFVWEMEKGEQPMLDGKTGDLNGGKGNAAGGPFVARKGTHTKCVKAGVPMERVVVALKQLKGRRADIKNGRFTIDGASLAEFNWIFDGQTSFDVIGPGGYFAEGDHEVEISVDGEIAPKDDFENASVKNVPGEDDAANEKAIRQMAQMLGARLNAGGGPAGGGGSPNQGGNRSQAKNADEPVEVQIEITVDDPDLQAKYGVITEQIENRYVGSKEKLGDIAVRRFQESKMQMNTWSVEFAYLPCLGLNDVVTFNTPETAAGGTGEVTGLLTALRVSYDSAPNVKMRGTIESFEDIGATDYVIGNLLLDPGMKGVGNTDWSITVTGDGFAQVADGFGFIDAPFASTGQIELTQPQMEVGEEYTISFDQVLELGNDNLVFAISDATGNISVDPLQGSASVQDVFTARHTTTVFRWEIPGLVNDTQYRIKNVFLSKAVTR